MKYWKMHVNRANYILLNNRAENLPEELLPDLARRLCSPDNLGADHFLVVDEGPEEDTLLIQSLDANGLQVPLTPGAAAAAFRLAFSQGLCGFQFRADTPHGPLEGQRLEGRLYSVNDSQPITVGLVAKGEIADEALPNLYWMLFGIPSSF